MKCSSANNFAADISIINSQKTPVVFLLTVYNVHCGYLETNKLKTTKHIIVVLKSFVERVAGKYVTFEKVLQLQSFLCFLHRVHDLHFPN